MAENILLGREIEVVIRNYTLSQEITLDNSFAIDFQFFKTTDETNQASTGSVTVKNLSDETFQIVSMKNSCQMIVNCGYRGDVKPLFVADIISCVKDYKGVDVNTTFQVSANYFEYTLGGDISLSMSEETTIDGIIDFVVEKLNERDSIVTGKETSATTWWGVPKPPFSDEDEQKLFEYFKTAKVGNNYAYVGSLSGLLKNLSSSFGIVATSYQDPNNKEMVGYLLTLDDRFCNHYLDKIYTDYPKIQNLSSDSSVRALFDGSQENIAFILNNTTGMIGSPQVEFKVFTVPENYKGLDTDEQTFRSQVAIANKNQKEGIRRKKFDEAQKKRVDSGKEKKVFKPRKVGKKQIKKVFLKVSALINPNIKPQSIIKVESIQSEYSGIYRVRNVSYKGGNYKGQNFVMELYLEDTGGRFDTDTNETSEEYQGFEQEQVSGELGESDSFSEGE